MAVEQKEKPKTISIKEFKMWLQGVEEMQADGWVPDARQWERIRAKIDQIDDAAPAVPYTGYRAAATEASELPPGMNMVFQPLNGAPPSGSGAAVPLPSALNAAGPAPRVPRAVATPSGLPVTLASGTPNVPTKTPDVDTSNGKPYNSSFA